jgi:hypothetical protein
MAYMNADFKAKWFDVEFRERIAIAKFYW